MCLFIWKKKTPLCSGCLWSWGPSGANVFSVTCFVSSSHYECLIVEDVSLSGDFSSDICMCVRDLGGPPVIIYWWFVRAVINTKPRRCLRCLIMHYVHKSAARPMSPYREQAHREKILEPMCVWRWIYKPHVSHSILQYTRSPWQAVFLGALHDE